MNPIFKLIPVELSLLCLIDIKGFYLLRFVTVISFVYMAYCYSNKKQYGWGLILGAFAILYLPFSEISINHTLWIILDISSVLLLIYLAIVQIKGEKSKIDSKEEPHGPIINSNSEGFKCPEYIKLSEYGYIRTIADIIKCRNKTKCFSNPEELVRDINNIIEPFKKRGTVTSSSVEELTWLINKNSFLLFEKGSLDVNELARIIDRLPNESKNPIEDIYAIREKAKLFYALKLANTICHYTNAETMGNDLKCLYNGEVVYGWHSRLLDDSNPQMDFEVQQFLDDIKNSWMDITKLNSYEGKALDNDMLESFMFSDYEKKIMAQGVEDILKEDYETVYGCASARLFPIKRGTGPVYAHDKNHTIEKTCYPTDDYFVEKRFYKQSFAKILVNNMVDRKEYKFVYDDFDGYYMPVKDKTLPIYDTDMQEVKFQTKDEETKFLQYWGR